ncbi:hypothetical protein ACFQZC_11010 [Streptacidiphilus monticola]
MQTDPNNPDDPQGQVYGYQILGSYLRTGTYDEHFLLPVTEHITQLSEKNPMMWTDGSRENSNLRLNFQDASAGYNPLSGAMEALGHNPRASLDFFHNPETLYGADGTPTGKTAPNGYLDYLTSDSDKNALIIADTTGGGPKEYAAAYKAQVATLGHALQSATTGVPYDAGDGTPLPQHSPEMAALANQVVHRFGSHPELLSGEHNGNPLFSPLNESVAHITGSYIGDVDRSLNNTTTRLPVFGSDAHFNTTDTRQLLHALGRDPDSYGVVLQAQNGYTAAQLQNVAHASDPHDPQLGDVFSNISHDGGVATGILGQARVQELQQNNAASDAQYNAAIDRNTEVAKTVWSMTLGSKVDAVPVVGGALNEGVSSYIDHLADGFHQDSTLKSIHDGNDLDVQAQNATMDAARNAVHHAMQGSGLDSQKIDDYADTAAKEPRTATVWAPATTRAPKGPTADGKHPDPTGPRGGDGGPGGRRRRRGAVVEAVAVGGPPGERLLGPADRRRPEAARGSGREGVHLHPPHRDVRTGAGRHGRPVPRLVEPGPDPAERQHPRGAEEFGGRGFPGGPGDPGPGHRPVPGARRRRGVLPLRRHDGSGRVVRRGRRGPRPLPTDRERGRAGEGAPGLRGRRAQGLQGGGPAAALRESARLPRRRPALPPLTGGE